MEKQEGRADAHLHAAVPQRDQAPQGGPGRGAEPTELLSPPPPEAAAAWAHRLASQKPGASSVGPSREKLNVRRRFRVPWVN